MPLKLSSSFICMFPLFCLVDQMLLFLLPLISTMPTLFSGSLLRATVRLSQRYLHIPCSEVLGVPTLRLEADTPPPSMRT